MGTETRDRDPPPPIHKIVSYHCLHFCISPKAWNRPPPPRPAPWFLATSTIPPFREVFFRSVSSPPDFLTLSWEGKLRGKKLWLLVGRWERSRLGDILNDLIFSNLNVKKCYNFYSEKDISSGLGFWEASTGRSLSETGPVSRTRGSEDRQCLAVHATQKRDYGQIVPFCKLIFFKSQHSLKKKIL